MTELEEFRAAKDAFFRDDPRSPLTPDQRASFEGLAYFDEAPGLHPKAHKITGTICGVRIEEIEHPLMRSIRYMDKLVDELAKGRPMEKILRS